MNQFVYLVHLEYRNQAPLPASVSRFRPRALCERAARLPMQLQRYLPDPQVKVSAERSGRDPAVLRVTVVTKLDEEVADAAFVRFIRDCSRGLLPERSEASWMNPAIPTRRTAF